MAEATGARVIGDVQYGGVADVGHQVVLRDMLGFETLRYRGETGTTVLVPPDVRADALPDLVASLRIEDFAFEERPRVEAGGLAGTAELRRAALKSAGAGKYFLALGDPEGATPDWLVDAHGDRFVLDLEALKPVLKKRRPDVYLSGGR